MTSWNERLRIAMTDEGLKPRQLALELKVSAPTVAAWVGAADIRPAKNITGENLLRVCRFLRIRPEWLTFGELPMRPRPVAWPLREVSVDQLNGLDAAALSKIEAYILGIMAGQPSDQSQPRRDTG